jgi:hypothetical protein
MRKWTVRLAGFKDAWAFVRNALRVLSVHHITDPGRFDPHFPLLRDSPISTRDRLPGHDRLSARHLLQTPISPEALSTSLSWPPATSRSDFQLSLSERCLTSSAFRNLCNGLPSRSGRTRTPAIYVTRLARPPECPRCVVGNSLCLLCAICRRTKSSSVLLPSIQQERNA